MLDRINGKLREIEELEIQKQIADSMVDDHVKNWGMLNEVLRKVLGRIIASDYSHWLCCLFLQYLQIK